MELTTQSAAWFLSGPGCAAFDALKTLEDRSAFIYSYLRQITKVDFEEDQLLFRIAFFFADAVMGSTLPYGTYPAVIDPEKNPFVAYLKNADRYPGGKAVYYIFLSILHGIAAPMKLNEWVYEQQLEEPEYLEQKMKALGKPFFVAGMGMVSADAFAIEEPLQQVQLKLIWLMSQL